VLTLAAIRANSDMTSCPHPPTHVPTEGPITQERDAADYLDRHNITGLLSGMMAGLMLTLPADHIDYMHNSVQVTRELGLENVNWQTFVWSRHPHRDSLRRKLLRPPVQVRLIKPCQNDRLRIRTELSHATYR